MIVAVDARNLYRPRRRGTGKNLLDLYRHLAALRPTWQFILYYQHPAADDPLAGLPNVQPHRIDIPGYRLDLWEKLRLPWAARCLRADVLHCPANTAPRWPGAPLLVTIHDLIPLEAASPSPRERRWARNVAAAARSARVILTPSRYTAEQVRRTFGVSADKVIVNPWAPDTACRRIDDARVLGEVRRRYDIPADRPYVFGFGGVDWHKNTAGILSAWTLLGQPVREGHTLVLVGIEGPVRETFARQAAELGIARGCRLNGFVDEADLPALLSGATALCYPSLREGFGLPILDAFACGTPVLTGNATSLPEVAGEAAVLVDARSPQAIAGALAELLGDVRRRAELVALGRRRLEQFTWQACAARAAEAMERTAGEGRT